MHSGWGLCFDLSHEDCTHQHECLILDFFLRLRTSSCTFLRRKWSHDELRWRKNHLPFGIQFYSSISEFKELKKPYLLNLSAFFIIISVYDLCTKRFLLKNLFQLDSIVIIWNFYLRHMAWCIRIYLSCVSLLLKKVIRRENSYKLIFHRKWKLEDSANS